MNIVVDRQAKNYSQKEVIPKNHAGYWREEFDEVHWFFNGNHIVDGGIEESIDKCMIIIKKLTKEDTKYDKNNPT